MAKRRRFKLANRESQLANGYPLIAGCLLPYPVALFILLPPLSPSNYIRVTTFTWSDEV